MSWGSSAGFSGGSWGGSSFGLGGSTGTSALSFLGGERSNKKSKEAAREAMAFSGKKSDTAYQRAMTDMKKAGLNPILAAGAAPASTPMGAMAAMSDTLTPAVNTGLQTHQQGLNKSKTEQDNKLTEAKTANTKVETTLKKNLIPGSKALATLAAELGALLTAAVAIRKTEIPTYKKLFLTSKINVEKGLTKGVAAHQKFFKAVEQGIDTSTKTGKEALKMLHSITKGKSANSLKGNK